MKGLMQKLSRPDDLVVNFYAGARFAAKVCMLLDQHRKFVIRHVTSETLSATEAGFVLTFASQVLSLKYDISCSGKVNDATKMFEEERAEFLISNMGSVWEVPSGLEATPVLPGCVPLLINCIRELLAVQNGTSRLSTSVVTDVPKTFILERVGNVYDL